MFRRAFTVQVVFLKPQRYACMSQFDSTRHAVHSCHLLLLLQVYWLQSLILFLYVRAVASTYRYICLHFCLCLCISEHSVREHNKVTSSVRDHLIRVTLLSSHFRRVCFKLAFITLAVCSVSSTRSSLEVASRQAYLFQDANFSNLDDFGVIWKSYSHTRRATLALAASESRLAKKPSNIFVDAGRLHVPRYVSLQHYAGIEQLLLGRQHIYFTFNGKRLHLHDLRRLPSGTTIRLVCYPLKGGGAQEKLQVHNRESLRSRTKQDVRAIATALGVQFASGSRQARVYFPKEEMIDRILQKQSESELSAEVGDMPAASSSSSAATALRSTSLGTQAKSSQASLLRMFAAQRERPTQTVSSVPSPTLEPAVPSSSASLHKPLSRHNKHYAKAGKRKYESEGRIAAKVRYEKEAVRRCAFAKRTYKLRARAAKKKKVRAGRPCSS